MGITFRQCETQGRGWGALRIRAGTQFASSDCKIYFQLGKLENQPQKKEIGPLPYARHRYQLNME